MDIEKAEKTVVLSMASSENEIANSKCSRK